MNLATLVGRVALGPFAKALPPMGDTERVALEAGTVGFEGAAQDTPDPARALAYLRAAGRVIQVDDLAR